MATSASSDRLIFTLLFSVILHLVIVLGVSFDVFSKPTNAPANNLDITLVKQQDKIKPEEADFLAQANNEGGGELDTPTPEPTKDKPVPVTKDVPSAPPPAPKTDTVADTETVAVQPPAPEPTPPKPKEVEPKPEVKKPKPQPKAKPVPQPEKPVKKLTQEKAERKVEKTETAETAAKTEAEPEKVTKPDISARDLMMQARSEISELQEKLDKSTKALSERPKKRRISASTKEFAAAAYMKAWEMKVERIGNMNYPQEARQKGLSGSLMLSVDINPDGSVPAGGIVVSRSSGHKVLDDAAVKIVRLGAPYAAIPEDVLKNNDMLTVIRTWKFETGRGLSTR
ncbi:MULTISPECIES: energy transducer TonB [Methylophaga]|jgi:protein TonB|uniref:Protein TonB n=1 Tax=Methylophaga marina TaxID=45495 RepID=A0ABP3DB68_9GAMM|nr:MULTISPECIES: energy transducer TonB [Methylophaga]BDZ73499.1 hypothetical protein GCM10025856_12180 [Methylophaga marina]|tara:strand:- start:6464 stop:7486 length:1023 start_codon:yes stop_codon:yes gene_type:complete